jgi:hypothetical protein
MSGYETTTIPDDTLVRYLDGEASPEEVTRIEGAARGSADAERLWELREAGERFASVVGEVPLPELPPLLLKPPRRLVPLPELPPLLLKPPRRLPRAAAIGLLFVAGSAAALPPARSFVLDVVEQARSWIAGPPAAVDADLSRSSVGIAAGGPIYLVEIVGRQEGGVLRVVRGSGRELVADASGAEMVVLPDRLRIVLEPGATGDVVLTVPSGHTGVRVRTDGEERVVEPGDAGLRLGRRR